MVDDLRPIKKRVSLTVNDRLRICEDMNDGVSAETLAAKYGVRIESIRRIKRNSSWLHEFAASTESGCSRKKMRKPDYEDLDNEVYTWFVERRAHGEPIVGPLLCKKAIEINRRLGGPETFKASSGWLQRFRVRHDIRELSVQWEKTDVDRIVDRFASEFSDLLLNRDVDLENVYNMSETGLLWRWLPNKALSDFKEDRVGEGKFKKDRVNLGVCANATGDHKLPLIFVHRYENPRALRHLKDKLPVVYYSQENGCIDKSIFNKWIKEQFIPSVKKRHLQEGKCGKVVLLVDDCPTRMLEQKIEDGFEVIFLPFNTTPLIQPMEQSVIEELKNGYRKRLLRLALSFPLGVMDYAVNFDIKMCIDLAHESWDDLSSTNLWNAWNKLLKYVSREVPGSQNTPPSPTEFLDEVKAIVNVDENDVFTWLSESERHENCISGEDVDRQIQDKPETPPAERILGVERIEQMMEDLRLWGEDQPEHIRLHADALVAWYQFKTHPLHSALPSQIKSEPCEYSPD